MTSNYKAKIVKTIKVGREPWSLLFNPRNNRIYVSNSGDNTVSVIDDDKVIGTIKVGREPWSLLFNPRNNRIYVSNSGDNTVSVIDDDKVIGTIKVGREPWSLLFNPRNNRIYVSNSGDGTVSVIDNHEVIKTIRVGNRPQSLLFNPRNNRIYVSNHYDGTVSVIDNHEVIKTIRVGNRPQSLLFNPRNNRIYVCNNGDNTVSVIDNHEVIKTIRVGIGPQSLLFNPRNNRIYVCNYGDGTVSVIDNDKVIGTIKVGGKPTSLLFNPVNNRIYVSNSADDTVSVIKIYDEVELKEVLNDALSNPDVEVKRRALDDTAGESEDEDIIKMRVMLMAQLYESDEAKLEEVNGELNRIRDQEVKREVIGEVIRAAMRRARREKNVEPLRQVLRYNVKREEIMEEMTKLILQEKLYEQIYDEEVIDRIMDAKLEAQDVRRIVEQLRKIKREERARELEERNFSITQEGNKLIIKCYTRPKTLINNVTVEPEREDDTTYWIQVKRDDDVMVTCGSVTRRRVIQEQGDHDVGASGDELSGAKKDKNEESLLQIQSTIKNQYIEQISNYEILETLGEGGYAKVYKARRRKDSSLVAMKVPKVPGKDFVKEIAVWLNLNHPNVVKLLDYDMEPRPYIVMELMKETLHGKTFDKDTATRIILDVLSGLKYAHERGIIHRDIKPSNILLDFNGRAKVSDWGIAKFSDITTSANVAFTVAYASPEQLNPKLGPVDERTDVYQVCEVFYEILTGRPTFQGDIAEVALKKLNMEITPVSSINPALKEYDEIFPKCLSPKKEERYSTNELIRVLSNKQYISLTSRTGAYALVELAYLHVQLDNYEQALLWIEKIGTAYAKNAITSLEDKIKYNVGTKEDILKKIELLRNQIVLTGK